jgi:hypothetical protein
VDTQLGNTTFECLKNVQTPLRLLTSRESDALVSGFDEILKGYCASCPDVEIRRHVMIHDRYIFDAKSAIARGIERKWREAEKYLV